MGASPKRFIGSCHCSAVWLGALLVTACGDPATVPPTVATVQVYSGDAQVRYPGSRLPRPIVLQALDADGNPVEQPGLPVEWDVVSGGGSVDATAETNDRGRASAQWSLGPALGDQTMAVRIAGSTPVLVTARAVEPGPIVFTRMTPKGASFSAAGIHTMHPDGSDPAVAVPGEGASPAWAPDGSAIVFVASDANTTQLFRVTTSQWVTSQITSEAAPDPKGLLHIDPSFSPDGSRIVYNLKQSHRDCGDITWTQVFVADADGANRVRLTDGCGLGHGQASFSPGGDRIVFRSKRGQESVGIRSDHRFSIWVMNADGSDQLRLTAVGAHEDDPVWAPDGSRIYYTNAKREVWTVRPDGSGQELLWTPDTRAFTTTGVSPDGTHLLLDIFGTGEAFEVGLLDLATGEVTIIADGAYDSSWRR